MTEHATLATLPDVRETNRFLRAVDTGEILIDLVGDQPAIWIGTRRPTRYERFVKPAIDLVGALVLLFLTAPVVLAAMAAIRLTMGPGVLYRQTRVGRDGQPFDIVKLRTMDHDRRGRQESFVGEDRRRRHKSPDDPRHTRLGEFLRATSIDELPQLWNVVRGDMSLVGPRPELVSIVANYADWQHRRHDVKPGLTGLWQVAERDEEGNMHLHVATDLVYVSNVSFAFDIRLLLLTIPAVLGTPLRARG